LELDVLPLDETSTGYLYYYILIPMYPN